LNGWQWIGDWRNLNYFYAKRCPVKNQEFKPATHEKDIKLWLDFMAIKEKKLPRRGEERQK
jgi:hypothetical protein